MSPCWQHKAAFITQNWVYEWTRMPLGLMNSPISFQTLMSGVLREMNIRSVLVYIDDVLIFSKDFSTHLRGIAQVFSQLAWPYNLQSVALLLNKWSFWVMSSHVMGLKLIQNKTKSSQWISCPLKTKTCQNFLGYGQLLSQVHSQLC